MSPVKSQLLDLIECMPEQEQVLLFEIAKRFVSDDIATNDDVKAIEEAREEYEAGTTISHNDIDWN